MDLITAHPRYADLVRLRAKAGDVATTVAIQIFLDLSEAKNWLNVQIHHAEVTTAAAAAGLSARRGWGCGRPIGARRVRGPRPRLRCRERGSTCLGGADAAARRRGG